MVLLYLSKYLVAWLDRLVQAFWRLEILEIQPQILIHRKNNQSVELFKRNALFSKSSSQCTLQVTTEHRPITVIETKAILGFHGGKIDL